MWRIATLALAAPSAISNIELLIPFEMPQTKDRVDQKAKFTEDQDVDKGEPYSSIPAYAFTLDTDTLTAVPRADLPSSHPGPELKPSQSLYLSTFWQRPQDKFESTQWGYKRTDKQEDKRNGCIALANQHSIDAREVLLYLCTELVDVLSSGCRCCDEKREKEVQTSPTFSIPWFGPIAGRRHVSEENGSDKELKQQISV